jgi:hypothetical protein
MIFLHQASEWTIQSLVERCWLNALRATVNWFTRDIAFGHSVMAITGQRILREIAMIRAGWSTQPLLPSRTQTRRPFLRSSLLQHAAQLHDALGG